MKTKCLIQDEFCPNGFTHCCMECEYGKSNLCAEDCLNHLSKCGLCEIVNDNKSCCDKKEVIA